MPHFERNGYRSLSEVKARLTPAEERFERRRNTIGLFLGPLAAIALLLAAMPGLTTQAHRLAAIIAWVVIWWVTEPIPIPVTALIGAVLCVLFDIGGGLIIWLGLRLLLPLLGLA
jgi:sodium-dependent dicarboxylate transporter 2/3/5